MVASLPQTALNFQMYSSSDRVPFCQARGYFLVKPQYPQCWATVGRELPSILNVLYPLYRSN